MSHSDFRHELRSGSMANRRCQHLALWLISMMRVAGAVPVRASPAAPKIPAAYSARVEQLHRVGASGAAQTRFFAVFHDFALKMQRVDHRWRRVLWSARRARRRGGCSRTPLACWRAGALVLKGLGRWEYKLQLSRSLARSRSLRPPGQRRPLPGKQLGMARGEAHPALWPRVSS